MMHEELFPRPELLIGQPAKEVVRAIVRENPKIKGFSLVRYTPRIGDYADYEDEPDLLWHYDRDFKEVTGAGFDYVVGLEPHFNTEVGVISLVGVFREPDPRPNVIDLRREFAHIPMIEFFLPKRAEGAVPQIKEFLETLGKEFKGWILYSGQASYQFYGNGLIRPEEYPEFIFNLRYNAERGGIVDSHFARRAFEPNLFSGQCYTTLRLSPSHRHSTMPVVIDVV